MSMTDRELAERYERAAIAHREADDPEAGNAYAAEMTIQEWKAGRLRFD